MGTIGEGFLIKREFILGFLVVFALSGHGKFPPPFGHFHTLFPGFKSKLVPVILGGQNLKHEKKEYLDEFLPVQTIDELVRVVQLLEEFFNLLFLGTLVESINMHMSLPFLIERLAVLAGNLKKLMTFL